MVSTTSSHGENASMVRFVDYLIIGAGVAGSNAAYRIAKTFPNSKIVLLEQFKLLHKNGSSHGNSRIIRCAYDDVVYSQWGIRALALWKEMESESGMKVFTKTGGLDWGAADSSVQSVINVCKQNKLEHIVLTAQQLRERFKMFKCGDDHLGVYQPDAGVLNAFEAVRMALYLAMKNGVEIREEEKVIEVIPVQSGKTSQPLFVIVRTSSGACFITKKLVFCAGAWTRKCLRESFSIDVDLEVQRMSYFFWKLHPEYQSHFQKMPVWIYWSKQAEEEKGSNGVPLMDKAQGLGHYGMPALPFEFSDIYCKSGAHFPVEADRNTDPDNRSFETPKEKVELTMRFLSKMFNGIEYQSYEEMRANNQLTTCLYTMTKDDDFIIDTIENHENVVVFAGGSGHAFKFGPVLGEALCHLVAEPETKALLGRYGREKFSLKRQCLTNSKY